MKVVIDSNRLIAALLKDSTTRNILFNPGFEFMAPEFLAEEIGAHKDELRKKACVSAEEFDILLSLMLDVITILPRFEYEGNMSGIGISDMKDIPYIACCIATGSAGVWSHDPHMKGQNLVKVFTNIDMLRMS